MKPITIRSVDLDLVREPLIRPFGFKGRSFREKWVCRATLVSESGREAISTGGLAVLWSEEKVFSDHTETGGNLVMAAVLEFALQQCVGRSFLTPIELQEAIFEPVHAYARSISGRPEVKRTFVFNAMVALDNAAWVLYAAENGGLSFDQMLPKPFRHALSSRHSALASVATIGYNGPSAEVRAIAEGGQFVLKIKIGAAGAPAEMLAADKRRLAEIDAALRGVTTPHTPDGRLRYYLDANGRYERRSQVEELLEHASCLGILPQIAIFEEPFPEDSTENLAGLPGLFAADESLHDVDDVAKLTARGFNAFALKPAGKTLSLTLKIARSAHELGIPCFVADSACLPRGLDWNKNVAARLAALPGLTTGLVEANGPQNYADWETWIERHPRAGQPWLALREGLFPLDENFYISGGGIFDPVRPEDR